MKRQNCNRLVNVQLIPFSYSGGNASICEKEGGKEEKKKKHVRDLKFIPFKIS